METWKQLHAFGFPCEEASDKKPGGESGTAWTALFFYAESGRA
jgi:hypothetical protein